MSSLEKLKQTKTLKDFAKLIGYQPKTLSYILYQIPEENKYFVSICNNHDWNDLEDGLQMQCAEAENIDYIITRDRENGFKNSPVKTINPEEFLKL